MNRLVKDILNLSDVTISACVRASQIEHKLWLNLDDTDLENIHFIRKAFVEFTTYTTDRYLSWTQAWNGFVDFHIQAIAKRIVNLLKRSRRKFKTIKFEYGSSAFYVHENCFNHFINYRHRTTCAPQKAWWNRSVETNNAMEVSAL